MVDPSWLNENIQTTMRIAAAWQTLAIVPTILSIAWLILAWRQRGSPYDSCVKCRYATTSLQQPQCPECGANLSNRGVRPAGNPRFADFAAMLTTLTLSCWGLAWAFSGPYAYLMPQTYKVYRQTVPAKYYHGEAGYGYGVTLQGEAYREPWQKTVTAEVFHVTIVAGNLAGKDQQEQNPIALTWIIGDDKWFLLNRNQASITKMATTPLTTDDIADHLHRPPAAKPIRTARHIMAEIAEHPMITGQAFAVKPPIDHGKTTTWAIPANPKARDMAIRTSFLFAWAFVSPLLYCLWRRGRRVDWVETSA